MKRNFKDALKSAYSIPEPQRKDDFLQGLPEKEKKAVPFYIPLLKYGAVPVTAAVAIIIYTGLISTENVKEEYVAEIHTTHITTIDAAMNEAFEDAVNDNPERTLATAEEASDTFPVTTSTADFNEDTEIVIVTSITQAPVSADTEAPATVTEKTSAATSSVQPTSSVTTAVQATATTTRNTTTVSSSTTAQSNDTAATQTTTSIQYAPVYTTASTMTTPDYEVDEPIFGNDYRVTPDITYDVTDNIVDIGDLFNYSPPITDGQAFSWQSDADYSDAIVYGTVQDIHYTHLYGTPYTQIDIFIEYSMQYGDYYYGDMISVYVPGGFMSLEDFIEENWCDYMFEDMTEEEIAESTAFYDTGSTGLFYEGRSCLLFLRQIPDGSFRLTSGSDMSVYYQIGEIFTSYGDYTTSFTADELQSYLSE